MTPDPPASQQYTLRAMPSSATMEGTISSEMERSVRRVSFAASDNLRWRHTKKSWPGNSAVSLFEMCDSVLLYDRTGSYKSLTSLVSLILLEVLNETSCEVLSLLLPN